MPVLTPIPAAPADFPAAAPAAAPGPACSLQRSSSLWQLGIEAQELTTAIGQLAQQLETDDPEQRALALAELEAALLAEEGNKAALAAKADATCWVIEHLRGQAAYRQQQAKRLSDLARGDAGRADALEESLVFVLTQLQPEATRFSFPDHELSSRKSQAVVIDDEEALDPEWLAVKTTTQPDKAAIKEALKAGRQIAGAQLLSRRSWRIH
jgi:multidrug resistance efflux pump